MHDPLVTGFSAYPMRLRDSNFFLKKKKKINKRAIKLGEGFVRAPEDVCLDKEGTIYTATRNGWIKRLHRNGSGENWKMIDSNTLLGITLTKEGDLVVCDAEKVRY